MNISIKQNLFFTILAVMAMTLCFVSCSKDEEKGKATKLLPKTINWSQEGYNPTVERYSYDNQNRLIAAEGLDWQLIFTYDANNRPLKVEGKNWIENFEYPSANIVKATITYNDEKEPYLTMLYLNSNNQLTKEIGDSYIYNYEYYLDGNLKRCWSDNFSDEFMSYDDKRGIFYFVNVPDWLIKYYTLPRIEFASKVNNPLKDIYTINGQSSVFSISYSYNEQNLPTKITYSDYDSFGVAVMDIEYINAK